MAPASHRLRLLAPSRWTLRARLVVVVVTLLATVAVVIGTISVFALNAFLTRQLAVQVEAAAKRSELAAAPDEARRPDSSRDGTPGGAPGDTQSGTPGGTPVAGQQGDGDDGPDFLVARGQAAGTAGVRVDNGSITQSALLDADGNVIDLSAADAAALAAVPVDGRTHTVHLDRNTDYLALALLAPDGDVVVTALPLDDVHASVARLTLVIAVVTAAGLAAAAVGGAAIVGAALRPLARTARAAGRVAELPLDRGDVLLDPTGLGLDPDPDPRTEVGRVDAALARMLEHVSRALAARQAAEGRMRRFVADASHELRTPLASIRGYAELTRRTHDEDLPPDVAHAVGRVESEARRMTDLVEELLLLARLDEHRDLRADQVDLTGLVVDATADAHAAGAGHGWLLDLPDEPVTVVGDAARLHQVVANLLANARVHTPPGTTVTVGVRRAVDPASSQVGVVLEVVDDGPGIPPELLGVVFDRFTRADTSRGRTAGGTGLGLAIVAGVVEGHGGRVEVSSQPGRTVFRVVLPQPQGARVA